MSTDKNRFDTDLKKNLYRDLLFRATLWVMISLATAYLSLSSSTVTTIQYFERVGMTLMPVVNYLGTFGLLLCVLAFLLKDIEQTAKSQQVKDATRGYIGGFVRRVAGDISLWTLGALSTFIAVFLIVLWTTPLPLGERGAIVALGLLVAVMLFFTAVANVYVRRDGPTPLLALTKNPAHITLLWSLVLFILVWRLVNTAI